jgi:hypothetical protein
MVPLCSPGKNCEKKVPFRIFSLGTLFLQDISKEPRGTIFY